MIDAYDVLGIGPDADADEVKKAFRRMSLQHHPDKVRTSGDGSAEDANARFNEIKLAHDILQEPERRKIYDTFGIDLGAERPETEVWTIGLSSLASPLGFIILKTFLMRAILWILSFVYVGYAILLVGVVTAILRAVNFRYGDIALCDPDALPMLLTIGLTVAMVLVIWVWQLLAEAVGIFYLVSEIIPLAMLVENWKISVVAGLASLFLAWLFQGWWFWIIILEIAAVVVVLICLAIACGLMGLWIEGLKTQHGDALKESRLRLRRHRKALKDEIAELKRKVQELESPGRNGQARQ